MLETIQQPTETKARKNTLCDFCLQPIEKGTMYIKSVHKYEGDIYSWKSHKHCSELVSKLKMHDHVDEGVTEEVFNEYIREEYSSIMSETQNELYESKDFVIPKFKDQLLFVANHYSIKNP